MATKSVSEPNVTDIIQRVRDYDMDAIVCCAEDALRLAMEQTQLLVQLADACERLHGELNNCETCGGTLDEWQKGATLQIKPNALENG